MILVRATQKLLKLSKIKPEPEPPAPDAPLGEWYANAISLTYPGQSAVLYTHCPSRLSVVVRGRSLKTTIAEFEPRLLLLLLRLGADDYLLRNQQQGMQEVCYAKTDSRSMLGSMNEIGYHIQARASMAGSVDRISFDALEDSLSVYLFTSKELDVDYFKPIEHLRGSVFTNRN